MYKKCINCEKNYIEEDEDICLKCAVYDEEDLEAFDKYYDNLNVGSIMVDSKLEVRSNSMKGVNEERMKKFMDEFERTIFPTIKGNDGEGIERLRKVVEEKRIRVNKRKQDRKEV